MGNIGTLERDLEKLQTFRVRSRDRRFRGSCDEQIRGARSRLDLRRVRSGSVALGGERRPALEVAAWENDMKRAVMAVSLLVASAAFPALAQDKVFVGHLADYTGATSFVGKYYGPGVRDAVDFINANVRERVS